MANVSRVNGFKPVNIPEKKVEEKVVEDTPAATAEEPKATEKPASETPQENKVEEPKKVETQPIVAEPQKVQSLEEVLKNNQPDTILKALGFDDKKVAFIQEIGDIDDKVVGIIQAWKNGQLGDYINALGTDYSKMSDVDVMRNQLRREYPKVSDAAFEALFEDEVLDKYKLDSETYSEAEVAKGKLLLEAKAARYRDELMTNQEKFLMPQPPQPKAAPQPDNTAEVQAKQRVEAYRKELSEDPFTKDIIANKKITLGEGDEKFSYPVEADSLIDILTDGGKWAENMWDATTNKPKIEHQLAVAAFAQDSKKFLAEYAKHLKAIGAKEVIAPIDNASEPEKSTASKSEAAPVTAAGNLAKHGKRNDGSN